MDRPTIWFDFENSPQVRYLLPVVHEVEKLGYATVFTARDVAETVGLLSKAKLPIIVAGGALDRARTAKLWGTISRAFDLWTALRVVGPVLSLSASRPCAIVSRLLNIPSLIVVDYEHSELQSFNKLGCFFLAPSVISTESLAVKGILSSRIIPFPGLKEDITFSGESAESLDGRERIPFDSSKMLFTVRPPGMQAHYETGRSGTLFMRVMERLASESAIQTLILPRTYDDLFKRTMELPWRTKPFVPVEPLDGTAAVWQSDAVLTGGGTMAREAAVLGVPAYSVFAGPVGQVDAMLIREGRLQLLRDENDIGNLRFERRKKSDPRPNPQALQTVVNAISALVLNKRR